MLRWRLVLLAALLGGSRVRGDEIRLEPLPLEPGAPIAVAWSLPPGFDESELLVEIDGGSRVRLTGELRSRTPRVRVSLPRLAGRARFVVRAGRDEDDAEGRGLAERDVAFSESFDLGVAATTSARTPVRAAASRPSPGREMEWWSEPPASGLEGPAEGLSASRVAGGALDPDRLHIKKRRRPASPGHSGSSSAALTRDPFPGSGPSRPPGSRPFSGAVVPLRI